MAASLTRPWWEAPDIRRRLPPPPVPPESLRAVIFFDGERDMFAAICALFMVQCPLAQIPSTCML